MNRLLKPLRELWRGVKSQIELILLTALVNKVSAMAQEKVRDYATKLNAATDKRFGERADVVQRAVADNLEIIMTEFRS